MATRRQIVRYIVEQIADVYDRRESEAIARIILCERLSLDYSHLLADYDAECQIDDLESIVADLQQARPLQHILGKAEFCGLTFEVDSSTLIPRPETEELVELVARYCTADAHILDVGCGSGAIAIALAHRLPAATLTAIDISEGALAVARRNGERNGVDVTFLQCDALGDISSLGTFDVVVSNPPYIPLSAKGAMHRNVVDYEPHTALFVADNDPLLFYRRISENGQKILRSGAILAFEIYEEFAADVVSLLERLGYIEPTIVRDANDKDRIVWARWQ